MKRIGSTENNNILVEMSTEEYNEFLLLKQAAEGVCWNWQAGLGHREHIDKDFKETFSAIRKWIDVKFRLNDLQFAINGLTGILGGKK